MKENKDKNEETLHDNISFSHPLPEGSVCVSPSIDVLDYCRVERVSDDSVFLRNDASLLFHLRDVEKKYGVSVANSLASRSAAASPLQSDLDGLSDDELFRTVVPKNVQSPSEVKMFTEHLGDMAAAELSKLDSLSSDLESSSGDSSSGNNNVNTV